MGPSWTPTFPLLGTQASALCSLPLGVQAQMAILQAGNSMPEVVLKISVFVVPSVRLTLSVFSFHTTCPLPVPGVTS